MVEFDRGDIIDRYNYQFDANAEASNDKSKKSLLVIGILLGLFMNFLAFLIFFMFHKQQTFKKVSN